MSTARRVILVGTDSSPYVRKMRMYFKHRAVAFQEAISSPKVHASLIKPRTNLTLIPVVVVGDNLVLQDTSRIIDFFEARLDEFSALPKEARCNYTPSTPVQRSASRMVELIAEEWLFLIGFAHRFDDIDTNREYLGNMFMEGSGRLTNLKSKHERGLDIVRAGYLPARPPWGVTEETMPRFTAHLESLLVALSNHFDQHLYLLSDTQPSFGDFALAGQLSGFFMRDPKPSYLIKTKAPNVERYVERMERFHRYGYERSSPRIVGLSSASGAPDAPITVAYEEQQQQTPTGFLANDVVPETLDAILALFLDMATHADATAKNAVRWTTKHAAEFEAAGSSIAKLPRGVGMAPFSIDGKPAGKRATQSYLLHAWNRVWIDSDPNAPQTRSLLTRIARNHGIADPDAEALRVANVVRSVHQIAAKRNEATNKIEVPLSIVALGSAKL
ncbi:hypothetical protein BC828DRAFT_405209 [Blastocladiella britannica]|nr:hypothetical protein BC828DRAFT_405209 [Blastocladiella britannica]